LGLAKKPDGEYHLERESGLMTKRTIRFVLIFSGLLFISMTLESQIALPRNASFNLGGPLVLSIEHYKEVRGWKPVVFFAEALLSYKWMDPEGAIFDEPFGEIVSPEPLMRISLDQRLIFSADEVIPFQISENNAVRTKLEIPEAVAKTRIEAGTETGSAVLSLFSSELVLDRLTMETPSDFPRGPIRFSSRTSDLRLRLIAGLEPALQFQTALKSGDDRSSGRFTSLERRVWLQNAANPIPENERNALIAIYIGTKGDGWKNKSNWKKPDGTFNDPGTEETWYGVRMTGASSDRHVTELSLNSNNLDGPVPDGVGDLTFLKYLNLRQNKVNGPFPSGISRLTRLETIDFYMNAMTGNLPSWLGDLPALASLNLTGNQFSGPLPPELGQLTGLRNLTLQSNQFTGAIPSELGNLTNLVQLWLNGNLLEGGLPSSIGNLHQLETLYVSFNHLTLPLPAEVGLLTSLLSFAIYNNSIEGPLPSTLGNLSNLKNLYFSFNKLSGPIPPEIGNLSNLSNLGLGGNQLSGPIPPSLGNLLNLRYFQFNTNSLSGEIPASLRNLINVEVIGLGENQFGGDIPPFLASLPKLKVLQLYGNDFEGTIPGEFASLSSTLSELSVKANRLQGPFPPVISELRELTRLDISGNMFEGPIPSTVAGLAKLTGGSLAYNALYADDQNLRLFLNARFDGWEDSQTVAPSGLNAFPLSLDSIKVVWTRIPFVSYGGGYKIFVRLIPLGSWTLGGTTTSKYFGQFTLFSLEPDTEYRIAVQTFTNPHGGNPNIVSSALSPEIAVITPSIISALEEIIADVESSPVDNGLKKSLTAKLENAVADLRRGQKEAAVHKIEAFQNEVRAQRWKKISPDLADAWIEASDKVIGFLRKP